MTATVADDILLLIFDTLSGPTCLQFPDAKYDHERACAPFVFASVCRQWRLLARSTCTLWTYLGFPGDSDQHGIHLTRLQALIPLVKCSPIDVLVGWDSPNLHQDTKQLLDELMRLIPQWRSAQFDMPRRVAGPFVRLTHVAPVLQQLSITAEGCALCLPKAHQLMRVHLDCEDVILSDPLSHWPNVSSWCSYMGGDKSARFCTAYAAQLVELFLVEHDWLSETLYLPCLQTLLLNSVADLDYIRAPELRNLIINAGDLGELADSASHFARIQHLTLYGSVGANTIRRLGCFAGVSKVSFMVPIPIRKVYSRGGITCQVDAGFFIQLAGTQPPVWPCLEHISFTSRLEYLNFNELLTFIESRNLRVHGLEGVESSQVSIIKDVTIDPQSIEIPAWFPPRLEVLLPADRC
ncbi:hypothetical protein BKA62DRAFT_697556 [Auriculariales sp. MPI-PUGE-AT-0066]|nr:hypothetical protein BKA62DRAFT_697556 [Auriculariales sp. MPI-PUGE-AT-0066]